VLFCPAGWGWVSLCSLWRDEAMAFCGWELLQEVSDIDGRRADVAKAAKIRQNFSCWT
jgi:hypothetical protein